MGNSPAYVCGSGRHCACFVLLFLALSPLSFAFCRRSSRGQSTGVRPFEMIRFLVMFTMVISTATRGGEPGAERADPWSATAQYRFNEAYALFENALRDQPGDRAWRLGHAAALLNRPPRSASSIEEAAGALATLVAEEKRDEVGIAARYLLARIAGIHNAGASLADAAAQWKALLDEAPHHPLAQHGGVKLCLLLLYEPDLSPEPDFAAAEAVLERLTLTGPRRDGHVALGRAYLYYRREPQRALAHLQAAFEQKLQSPAMQASLGVSIAEVATGLGQTELARTRYREFLRTNPRDVRAQLVRDRLAALTEARGTGATP